MADSDTALSRVQHWAALDGMRAFAVVVVMIYHWSRPHVLTGGLFGVDVFFVLSGFLITSLLIGEWDKRGAHISFRNFYARRALRLFPALAAVIVMAVLAVTLAGRLAPERHQTLWGLPWVILYVGNWARIPPHDSNGLGLLGHTWSLAVEEQFYLIWPAVFLLIVSKAKSRQWVAVGVASAAAIVWMYRAALLGAGVSIPRVGGGTDTHCDGLLIGCALAFWLASGAGRAAISKTVTHAAAIAGTVLVVAAVLLGNDSSAFRIALGYTLVPVATAAVLLDQVTTPLPALRALLSWGPMVWVGKRSYGLYLWHYPIYGIFATFSMSRSAREVTELTLSFVVAAISFEVLEKPALRLKSRFQRDEAMPAPLTSQQHGL